MNITDEAVEAAARVMPCLWRPARVGHPTHRFCEDCRKQALRALEAAAPLMTAALEAVGYKGDDK